MTLRALLGCVLAIATMAGAAAGQSGKSLPNRAGNRTVSLRGEAVTDRKEVTKIMGIDLGEGYALVRIEITPETPEGLYVSIDDFTLISRKDGERGSAMAPSEIAGSAGLIISRAGSNGGGIAARQPVPVPGVGVGGAGIGGGGVGNVGGVEGGLAEARQAPRRRETDPRLEPLERLVLRDGEITGPLEGLLYFYMEGKVKPKDLGLIYAGPGGRLIIDFK